MALPSIRRLWSLARQVEDLFKLQSEAKGTFSDIANQIEALEDRLEARLRTIEDRLLRLETERPNILSEARREALNEATRGNADIITRLTKVEMGLMLLAQQRPPKPDAPRTIRGEGTGDIPD